MYICRPCDAYVGTHGNTNRPLGTMAKYQLRELRKEAHRAFDPIWKNLKIMSRTEAYAWMQEEMGLHKKEAHIGLFTEEQCNELIKKIYDYLVDYNKDEDDFYDEMYDK